MILSFHGVTPSRPVPIQWPSALWRWSNGSLRHPNRTKKTQGLKHLETETLTLQGTNISPKNGILKMIFLFPRWDMLIPWRVIIKCCKKNPDVYFFVYEKIYPSVMNWTDSSAVTFTIWRCIFQPSSSYVCLPQSKKSSRWMRIIYVNVDFRMTVTPGTSYVGFCSDAMNKDGF